MPEGGAVEPSVRSGRAGYTEDPSVHFLNSTSSEASLRLRASELHSLGSAEATQGRDSTKGGGGEGGEQSSAFEFPTVEEPSGVVAGAWGEGKLQQGKHAGRTVPLPLPAAAAARNAQMETQASLEALGMLPVRVRERRA